MLDFQESHINPAPFCLEDLQDHAPQEILDLERERVMHTPAFDRRLMLIELTHPASSKSEHEENALLAYEILEDETRTFDSTWNAQRCVYEHAFDASAAVAGLLGMTCPEPSVIHDNYQEREGLMRAARYAVKNNLNLEQAEQALADLAKAEKPMLELRRMAAARPYPALDGLDGIAEVPPELTGLPPEAVERILALRNGINKGNLLPNIDGIEQEL